MSFRVEFEHRDHLRRAALGEFCARGYDAASLNRILAASGVSKGQLYHHFDGKEGLYLALVEWVIDEKAAWFTTHPFTPTGDLFTTLADQVRASLEFAEAHADADRLSRSLLGERGRPIFATVTARFGFSPDGPLDALLDHHRQQGTLRDDVPAGLIRRFVALVVNNLPDLVELEQPSNLERGVAEVLAILRDGLAADTAAPVAFVGEAVVADGRLPVG